MNQRRDASDMAALLDAVCDGRATDMQRAELFGLMRRDPAALRAYVDYLAMHGELQWRMREVAPMAGADAAERTMHAAEGDEALALIDPMPLALPRRSVRAWAMALAAMLTIAGAAAAVYVAGVGGADDRAVAEASVAVLLDAVDATWTTQPLNPGATMTSGVIGLAAGRIELELTSGVLLELTGPAELDLRSDMAVRLRTGRLWAHAEPSFRVDTPRFTVVDLGTEFGVTVDADGGGQVHVIEGSAEVQATVSRVLSAGQAWVIGADGAGRTLAYDPTPYVRDASPMGRPTGYVHYRFDEADGVMVLDGGEGLDGGPFNAQLIWAQPGTGGAERVEGRFGRALRFDGVNDCIHTTYSGVGGDKPRTIAMWVNVPRDARNDQANAMLTFGRYDRGAIWQMSWNSYGRDGAVGALRVGLFGEQAVGRTDLRDGRWHHVAATFDGATVRLYVDGRLDAERDVAGRVDTDTGDRGTPVRIGRAILADASSGAFFRGMIDEVWLFDAALNDEQVRRLGESNEPPGR